MQKHIQLLQSKSSPPPAIEIHNLRKTYTGRGKNLITAVEHIDLSIPQGQVFGFLGTNGAGKTTTIKMTCGLVTPTTGTIRLNGYDVIRQRKQAMQQIGAVLEGTRNIYWRLSAWQNLMYFGRLKGCRGKELAYEAERLLRELDLWDRRRDPIRTFSRGMQQKVAIACALIANPPIVLLDEPTLGLDVQAAMTVKGWIQKLTREQGKTVVLTTHQLDMAEELCDRVAIIRKGRILADQPLNDLLHFFAREYYQIRIKGNLADLPASNFEGFTSSYADGETTLSGSIEDQATLYELLDHLRALPFPLSSVAQVEPNLEEVFMNVINEKTQEEQHELLAQSL